MVYMCQEDPSLSLRMTFFCIHILQQSLFVCDIILVMLQYCKIVAMESSYYANEKKTEYAAEN